MKLLKSIYFFIKKSKIISLPPKSLYEVINLDLYQAQRLFKKRKLYTNLAD